MLKRPDGYEEYLKAEISREEAREYPGVRGGVEESIKFALNYLNGRRGKAIDIGTRDGWGVEFLNQVGFDSMGVDINHYHVEHAKKTGRRVFHGDGCRLKFRSNYFDFVYSHHTIEHSEDMEAFLSEMNRIMKPDGFACCVFPVEDELEKTHYFAITDLKDIFSSMKFSHTIIYAGIWTPTPGKKKKDTMILWRKREHDPIIQGIHEGGSNPESQ